MSRPEAFSRREVIAVAGATGLAYIAIACLWIAFSDTLLVWMLPDADIQTMIFLQTLKGWGFVIVTGLLFTVILYRKLVVIGRTQSNLQEHMESYRMLFAHNPEPMWIHDPTTLRFVEVNDAAIRAYGYSREEFLGMTLHDIHMPDNSGDTANPADTTSDVRNNTVRHLWKNGSVRHVQVTSAHISFLGRTLLLTLANDITEIYHAEEELRRSERKFRDVLNNSIDVIYEINSESGMYNYISPSALRLLSIPTSELMAHGSQRLFGRVHSEDRLLVETHLHMLMTTPCDDDEQATPSVEYRILSPANEERWVRETSTIVSDDSARTRVIVGTIRDITARKKNENAIRKLNEELERRVQERTTQLESINSELEAFSYSVSHDLRAPLRSIGGFSKILIDDYRNILDQRGNDYLQRIQAAGQRMGMLINALLNLSHVTRSVLNRATIDISGMATAIIEDLKSAHPQRNVVFRAQPGITAPADSGLIHIVLENLLGNAWKFTAPRENAEIELFSVVENHRTVYGIRDNGVGFDMDYAGKLFTPFQRLHSATDFEGTGIGLATVQRIINRHGGQLWANGAVDHGAAFYFTLSVEAPV